MKKKICWVDVTELPGEEHTTFEFLNKEIPLLLLIKGSPYPVIGIYRVYSTLDPKTKKVIGKESYFHVRGSTVNHKVLAWRPLPKIPQEYHKVTGYDKILEAKKCPKTHKRKT